MLLARRSIPRGWPARAAIASCLRAPPGRWSGKGCAAPIRAGRRLTAPSPPSSLRPPPPMPATRTTAHDDAVKVRAFEAADEPQVLELLKAAFGAWPGEIERGAPAEFFRWKHMASPFGPSVLMVAETDGEVIGFYAYMAWRFRAQVGVLTTMRGVDLAVHPAHRRRGVSLAIRAEPEFSDDVAFFWSNPNEPSRPGSLMAGRHRVGKFPRFARPCGQLRETIRRAREQGSKTPAQLQVEADTASEILGDGAPASALLGQAKGVGDRLQTAKDLDYLRWRYGRFEDYRAVQTDAGQAGGLVIFRAAAPRAVLGPGRLRAVRRAERLPDGSPSARPGQPGRSRGLHQLQLCIRPRRGPVRLCPITRRNGPDGGPAPAESRPRPHAARLVGTVAWRSGVAVVEPSPVFRLGACARGCESSQSERSLRSNRSAPVAASAMAAAVTPRKESGSMPLSDALP